ncbi:radical SAM protein [Chloroflexota bacterium]
MDLFEAFKAFPEVAKPIIVKSDVIRLGLKFSERARKKFSELNDVTYKGYQFFSYDRDEVSTYGSKLPVCLYLEDGTPDGTVIQVRPHQKAPYMVDLEDGIFTLYWNKESLGTVKYDKKPQYYERSINGIHMPAICHAQCDFLFVAANKHCDLFSIDKPCMFCDITPFSHTQKKSGQDMILRKNAELTGEVLKVALNERRFRHILISGGMFLRSYQRLSQVEWYAQFLETIRKKIGCWRITSLQVAALEDEDWKRLHETGVPFIQPNIEVWDKRLFEIICQGKDAVVGYDEWIKRVIRAVDFWGPGNVNPNFVCGVEMAKPFGFKDVDEAIESTASGYDYLMRNGVLPRQGNFWCVEPDSKLGGAEPPPLEYYIKLGKRYLEIREKNRFMTCSPQGCRFCQFHGTEYDFEYWHGNGPTSKKAEKQDLVVNLSEVDSKMD